MPFMNTTINRLSGLIVASLLPVAALASDGERSSINMPVGATTVSHEIYDLHMLVLWICVAIGVVVFGIMFYSMWAHRKSRGVTPATFHESTKMEIAWTVVPFLILLGLAAPATSTLLKIYDTSDADLTVMITGYQWKWRYDYIDHDVSFFSNLSTPRDEIIGAVAKNENYLLEVDEPLVIPAGQKVRFLLTAADVIHSWWVPELAVKKDAIPGFINETWTNVPEPGTFRGQCTELCGKDHGFMPVVVEVVEPEEFEAWLASRQADTVVEAAQVSETFTMDELMSHGEEVYGKACASCHMPNGQGIAGAFPALAGSAVAMGPIDAHLDTVVNGRPGTAMLAFGPQLSERDLAAVITYQRNAWGNNMGDRVQPADVAGYMNEQ